MSDDVSTDGFLGNRLMVRQRRAGAHRAGLDALLLAAGVPADVAGCLMDLGAGSGVAGLAVACRAPDVRLVSVDNDPLATALLNETMTLNGPDMASRCRIITVDLLGKQADWAACGLFRHSADHVIFNPPFHPADRGRPSPHADRAHAHRIDTDALALWMKAAASLLHPSGRMTMIYRADELPRLFEAIGTRFGSLVVKPVHPRNGEAANRVLVSGRPQGRAPLRLLPGLVLHDANGAYLPDVAAILRGEALINLT